MKYLDSYLPGNFFDYPIDDNLIIVAPRRSGKTTLLKQIASLNQNKSILILGPQKKHGQEVINRLKEENSIKSSNLKNIHLGSNKSDSIRGLSVDLLLVEEATYIDEDIFKTALLTTMYKDGKVILVGTPKEVNYKWDGEWKCDNWFKTLIDKNNFKYKCLNVGPILSPDELKENRRYCSEEQFKTEYLGEWVCKYEY